jgi:hypothetical protein
MPTRKPTVIKLFSSLALAWQTQKRFFPPANKLLSGQEL